MIKKIDLPYPVNALEPYYSKETLMLHYDVLYTGYVDNTNKTQEKLEKARESNNFENIKCLEKDLSFFGSGAILHELFFENLGPAIPTSPDIKLMEQINKDFFSQICSLLLFLNLLLTTFQFTMFQKAFIYSSLFVLYCK